MQELLDTSRVKFERSEASRAAEGAGTGKESAERTNSKAHFTGTIFYFVAIYLAVKQISDAKARAIANAVAFIATL